MHRVLHGFIAFLGELRRRRVYQVAAAYILAAWLIIEAASVIAPEFEFLPDGTVRFIIVLTLAVFPVVVALAWVYDVSGRGVVVTGSRDGEAQLTAILFSDLAGYTRLTETDEARAIAMLSKSRRLQKPLIARFGGRHIEDVGDGLLAIFPSASSAVNCALAISDTARKKDLHMRIGIHVGDVREEGKGIAGLGVNIAARIQTLTDVGGIAISEPVR